MKKEIKHFIDNYKSEEDIDVCEDFYDYLYSIKESYDSMEELSCILDKLDLSSIGEYAIVALMVGLNFSTSYIAFDGLTFDSKETSSRFIRDKFAKRCREEVKLNDGIRIVFE